MSKTTTSYDENLKSTLEGIITNEIYVMQSSLVDMLIEENIIDPDEVINIYDDNDEPIEIMEWYAVSDWLVEKLEEKKETIIKSPYGCWWGRASCGYPLEDEAELKKIAQELNQK